MGASSGGMGVQGSFGGQSNMPTQTFDQSQQGGYPQQQQFMGYQQPAAFPTQQRGLYGSRPFTRKTAKDFSTPTANVSAENFDSAAYMKQNPDVASNWKYGNNAYQHYLDYGIREGRAAPMVAGAEPAVSAEQQAANYNNEMAAKSTQGMYAPSYTNYSRSPYMYAPSYSGFSGSLMGYNPFQQQGFNSGFGGGYGYNPFQPQGYGGYGGGGGGYGYNPFQPQAQMMPQQRVSPFPGMSFELSTMI